MNFRNPSLLAASCLIFAQAAAADMIVLKSGEKINGTVIREDGKNYVVEVKLGTIRDEKLIPRDDVSYIDKQKADEKAFVELEGLLPTPELLSKEAYEARTAKLEGFVKAYPESRKVRVVKEMLDVLGEEHAVVAAGGIKFGEEMVSADDYESNAYAFDVRIAEKKIKDSVARRDLLGALRKFSEYDVKFGQSESNQGMAALILQVLKAYRHSLDENLASLERRIEKRQSGLASMSSEDRPNTELALKEQMKKLEKRYMEEKAAGQKWISSDAFHKQSMDEALRHVTAEISRIEGRQAGEPLEIPLAEIYRIARSKLVDGTEAEKKKVLDEAKANRLTEFYLQKLRICADLDEN